MNNMSIFEILKQEHQQVENLFSLLESSKNSKQISSIFDEIYRELSLHTQAEELSFYPAMYEHSETRPFIDEAEQEHIEAKILLEELKMMSLESPEFMDKMMELKAAVQHHVQEEEEEVFPKVREAMSEDELRQLSQEFQDVKSKLEQDMMSPQR